VKRDIAALTAERFDILVIGGGVHGAFAAWDAALRGLRVALVERGDFGGGTSSNSLKIAHGGFRHLRNADLRALRASLDEQIALQRIAPHLVRPLPCVMEAGHRLTRASTLMGAALAYYRAESRRRARRAGSERAPEMSVGGIVRGDALARLVEPLESGWRAGAVWTDALIRSPERLMMGVLRAAVDAGAVATSYVEARSLTPRDADIAVDVIGEECGSFTIRTRLVLDARGPWTNQPIAQSSIPQTRITEAPLAQGSITRAPLARACNIVVRAPIHPPRAAVAFPHPNEPRMLFAVPWRDRLMLGTTYHHAELSGDPRDDVDVERLVQLFDAALPGISLERREVEFVHCGLLPAESSDDLPVKLRDRSAVVDWCAAWGIDGIVSMLGVKWTTARAVAERAVDLCQAKLRLPVRPGGTDRRPIAGGETVEGAEDSAAHPAADRVSHDCCASGAPAVSFDRDLYGSLATEVAAIARQDPSLAIPLAPGSRVIGAQIAHAVRHEMALHLDDIVLRRSELGAAGMPSEAELSAAAQLAAAELGWSEARTADELARVRGAYWWRCA
jgi:glycerol-3-phosphate dehydrogenase